MNDAFAFGVLDNRFLSRSVGLLNPKDPLTLPESASVEDGVKLLQAHKSGAVLLVDKHERILGIFTERDVLIKVALGKALASAPLTSVMTKEPHTISMTSPIGFALQLMSQGGYRHLPIIDDDEFPLGIISVKDIVDYVVASMARDVAAFGS